MGAYAVEEITYEQGQSGNLPAVAVSIRYNRTRREILQMPTAADMDQAASRIQVAVNGCNSSVVMLVERYEPTDFVQLIEDYAASYPEWVIEIPTVAEATYPGSREPAHPGTEIFLPDQPGVFSGPCRAGSSRCLIPHGSTFRGTAPTMKNTISFSPS